MYLRCVMRKTANKQEARPSYACQLGGNDSNYKRGGRCCYAAATLHQGLGKWQAAPPSRETWPPQIHTYVPRCYPPLYFPLFSLIFFFFLHQDLTLHTESRAISPQRHTHTCGHACIRRVIFLCPHFFARDRKERSPLPLSLSSRAHAHGCKYACLCATGGCNTFIVRAR